MLTIVKCQLLSISTVHQRATIIRKIQDETCGKAEKKGNTEA